MVTERVKLQNKGLSDRVINTILNSRKPVTRAIYEKIRKKFVSWYEDRPISNGGIIPIVLDFLQDGADKNISPSTLKVQVAALSSVMDTRLAEDPLIRRFLIALKRSKPAKLYKTPTWDMGTVLKGFLSPPFEPIEDSSDKNLTLKTALLLALVSARRVSEIQALSSIEPYCLIHLDKIILSPDPAFLPKVSSTFHRTQNIVIPSLPTTMDSRKRNIYSKLDVRNTLIAYLERTKEWRRTTFLFILYAGINRGKQASKSTISRWIRMAIQITYKAQNLTPPSEIRAHSTRAWATSAAEKAGATPEQICRAATWSSFSTFAKHYRIDQLSDQDQAFGRKVLQSLTPP